MAISSNYHPHFQYEAAMGRQNCWRFGVGVINGSPLDIFNLLFAKTCNNLSVNSNSQSVSVVTSVITRAATFFLLSFFDDEEKQLVTVTFVCEIEIDCNRYLLCISIYIYGGRLDPLKEVFKRWWYVWGV